MAKRKSTTPSEFVTLTNVTDTRDGRFHSEVVVKTKFAKFFVK